MLLMCYLWSCTSKADKPVKQPISIDNQSVKPAKRLYIRTGEHYVRRVMNLEDSAITYVILDNVQNAVYQTNDRLWVDLQTHVSSDTAQWAFFCKLID
jgi:hypothetical protein